MKFLCVNFGKFHVRNNRCGQLHNHSTKQQKSKHTLIILLGNDAILTGIYTCSGVYYALIQQLLIVTSYESETENSLAGN